MPKNNEEPLGGHAVLLVGYVDNSSDKTFCESIYNYLKKKTKSTGYFILRNSWGVEFADKGYMYLPYEVFEKVRNDSWVIIQ